MEKYLEFGDGNSRKFWSVKTDGDSFTVRFGKIGTAGQTQIKSFNSASDADKEALKLCNSKLKKGYAEAQPPAGMSDAAPKEKKPKADVPRPIERKLPPAPSAVKDAGQAVTADDEYDEEYCEKFAPDYLRKPEEVIVEKQEARQAKKTQEAAKKLDGAEEFDAGGYAESLKKLKNMVKRARGKDAPAVALAALKAHNPPKDLLRDDLAGLIRLMCSDDVWAVSFHQADLIPLLLAEGVNIPEICTEIDEDAKPLFQHVFSRLGAGSTPEDAEKLVTEYFTGLYTDATERILKQLTGLVADIKAGKCEKISGVKLPDNITGFALNVDSVLSIYSAGNGTRFTREDFDEGDDIRGSMVKRYMGPIIAPKLRQLADEGFFNDIMNGYLAVFFYNDTEPLLELRADSKLREKAVELEKELQYLETTENWIEDAERLNAAVRLYFEPNGIIAEKDTGRLLNIIKRFLYSGEEKPEETALSLLHKYDNFDYTGWTYEFVLYQYANMDFDWSIGRMWYLYNDYGYEPARLKALEWESGTGASSDGDSHDDDDDDDETPVSKSGKLNRSYYEQTYGYGNDSNKAMHRDSFKDSDVFTETGTVIARAFSDGNIFIRFKEESEQAYSDALDFLNAIMAKGYSHIHDGYELNVRFLAEKMFFPEMKDLMKSYLWPDNDSHAFFCKAVHYHALRDKVAQFARLTLAMFDRYHNLDGEYSTVAGTFAAVAAAMSDIRYMDAAIKFAVETDGEHEELASHFSDILDAYYGVTPETAPAIAMLRLSYDHDDLGLSDAFFKYPANLQAVMDYFNRTEMPHEDHKICRLMNNIFSGDEPRDILKKLKKLFSESGDPDDKLIYASAHDWYLAAAEEEDEYDGGKPINYTPAPRTAAEKPVEPGAEDFTENPPCVIDMAELKKRKYPAELIDKDFAKSWLTVVFAPAYFTNPYEFEAHITNVAKLYGIKPQCYTVFDPLCAFVFSGKTVVDLLGAPYQCGMIIYDKKEAHVLYGVLDYAAIAVELNNKPAGRDKLMELRAKHLVCPASKGSPRQSHDLPGVKLMDESRDAMVHDKYMRALMKVNKITPEMGADVYVGALLQKTELLRKKRDKAALESAYTELAALRPQFKEYWDQKLAAL